MLMLNYIAAIIRSVYTGQRNEGSHLTWNGHFGDTLAA